MLSFSSSRSKMLELLAIFALSLQCVYLPVDALQMHSDPILPKGKEVYQDDEVKVDTTPAVGPLVRDMRVPVDLGADFICDIQE